MTLVVSETQQVLQRLNLDILFLVPFLDDPVNDFRNLEAPLRKFCMNGAVDMVYMIGFTTEFKGSTKTATQAYTGTGQLVKMLITL